MSCLCTGWSCMMWCLCCAWVLCTNNESSKMNTLCRAALEPVSCTTGLDKHGWFDPEVVGVQPNSCWLFMADAPQSCLASSGHTWLLWDETTTLTLSHTSQTPWKLHCAAIRRLDFWTTVAWTSFGIIWRSALFRFSLFSQPFYVFLFQSSLTPLLHTLCSSPPLLCSFILTCSRVTGKVPAIFDSYWSWSSFLTLDHWFGFTCPHLCAQPLTCLRITSLLGSCVSHLFLFMTCFAVCEIGNV